MPGSFRDDIHPRSIRRSQIPIPHYIAEVIANPERARPTTFDRFVLGICHINLSLLRPDRQPCDGWVEASGEPKHGAVSPDVFVHFLGEPPRTDEPAIIKSRPVYDGAVEASVSHIASDETRAAQVGTRKIGAA